MLTDKLTGVGGEVRLILFHRLKLWRRYERWLDDLLAHWLVYRPGTFVDVGAHVGEIVLKVKALRPEVPCIGFEPHPESWFAAQKLFRLNRLQDCHVLPFGLSRKPALEELLTGKAGTDSTASSVDGFRQPSFYSRRLWVGVFDGDTVLRQLHASPVSMIKIDVEGAELDALVGLERTLSTDRPGIICEVLPVYETGSSVGRLRKTRQDELQKLLNTQEYSVFQIARTGDLLPIDCFTVHSDLSRCEYFFVPAEEERAFIELFEKRR